MKKRMGKVVNFKHYKESKKKIEIDRDELLSLLKKIVTTK